MTELSVFVAGVPAPQGSKNFLGTFKGKDGRTHGIMGESSKKVKPWRADVRSALIDADGKPKVSFGDSPIVADLVFIMTRPKSTPKKKTPAAIRKPDLDKLIRSTFDAISSAGVWADDSRVIGVVASKMIAGMDEPTGCHIRLTTAEAA